ALAAQQCSRRSAASCSWRARFGIDVYLLEDVMLSTGRGFQLWMGPLLAVVGALLLVDGTLLIYSLAASARVPQQQELVAQSTQISLLRADVARARSIQRDMPKTKADCERFENSLPLARGGYSTITTELGELGRTSGLQISSLDFHSTPIATRGLTEVAVDADRKSTRL